MQTIYKYALGVRVTAIKVPSDAQVLSVGQQGHDCVVWIQHTLEPVAYKVVRIIAAMTGCDSETIETATFIGTVQRTDGIVVHFYLLPDNA